MSCSLRQLRILVTVTQAKSFSQVRDIIDLSQSTVGRSVKEPEGQTGVRLLGRTAREVMLTETGHQLVA